MSVTTRLKSLKINYLTQSQYDTALDNEEINENELYLTPDNNADFVVETGTSGIWTYRKWNSGIAELWGTTQKANYNLTTKYGEIYYTSVTLAVESGVFTSINSISVNRANGGQGTVWCSPYSEYSSIINGTLNMYVSNGTSISNFPLSFSIDIKGRWK